METFLNNIKQICWPELAPAFIRLRPIRSVGGFKICSGEYSHNAPFSPERRIDNEWKLMAPSEQRTCVSCHQPLPPRSKLTLATIPQEEGERNGWPGQQNSDGTKTVDMCLQCQIDRSKDRNDAPSSRL